MLFLGQTTTVMVLEECDEFVALVAVVVAAWLITASLGLFLDDMFAGAAGMHMLCTMYGAQCHCHSNQVYGFETDIFCTQPLKNNYVNNFLLHRYQCFLIL